MPRSTPPRQAYAYTTHAALAPSYYYEEQEGYVGDYTESDGLSDRSHIITSNANEIYRKKTAAVPQEHYRQSMYLAPSYYYEPVPTTMPQQMRRPAVPPTYRRHIPVVDERARYYAAAPTEETFRDNMVYSSPQITAVRRPPPPQPSTAAPARPAPMRRHPVTVRTPRYIRRPNAPNLCKKPSTLCLPLSCQIDPAVYRKTRKQSEEFAPQPYHHQVQPQVPLERRHSVPVQSFPCETPMPPPQSHQKNLHMTQSDLEAVLARYDTVFEDNGGSAFEGSVTDKCESLSSRSSIRTKISKGKLSSHLKPKVPPSSKQKQSQKSYRVATTKPSSAKTKSETSNRVKHIKVEEITTDVLDSMLTELMEVGCENKIGKKQMSPKKNESNERGDEIQRPGTATHKENQFPKSFTYHDITQNLPKSRPGSCRNSIESAQSSKKGEPPKLEIPPTPKLEPASTSISSSQNCSPYAHGPRALDENGVMELHRSKSYIVNLIDRALSKELGTVPLEERCSTMQKEPNDQSDARRAMGLVTKHMDKMDKGLCLEITQTLTDSLISNATAPPPPVPPTVPDHKQHDTTCSCNVQDEPLYIKQLRQLRWGHLRHIQREVRRLEDLERFLDSCSNSTLK